MTAAPEVPEDGDSQPEVVGHPLAWLTGEENTHMCGQINCVDGCSDAVIRGASTW